MTDNDIQTDPITAQVLREFFESVSAEMSRVVERTAVHPLFNEVHDYSTGLFYFDGENVSLIARATAIPCHIIASVLSVEAMLEAFKGDIREGDMFIVNDPYDGGTHQADWTIMKPMFIDDTRMIIPSVRAHMADFGGVVPGGYNPNATDAWQEGFRIPPMRLYEQGQRRVDIWEWILANTRISETLRGDLRAIIGACEVGEKRVRAQIEKSTPGVVAAAIESNLDYSERRFRLEISKWKDGVYTGFNLLDHDSRGTRDIRVEATVRVSGDQLTIDLTGTDPQVAGYVNSPFGNSASWIYTALAAVIPEDIQINSGVFRAVDIYTPRGSVADPLPPQPVMFCTVVCGGSIANAVMKALEQVVPDRVGSVEMGCNFNTTFGNDDRYDDAFYVTIEYGITIVGASGVKGVDGWGGQPTPMCGLIYATVEMMEIQFPFFYHEYQYVEDTAAPGEFRGVPGFSMEREIVGRHPAYLQIGQTGFRHPAPGWSGGNDGAGSYQIVDIGSASEERVREQVTRRKTEPGRILKTFKGGGGGWGSPLRRVPKTVLDDVLDGLVSIEGARQDYGVVIKGMAIDFQETENLRQARLSQ